MTAVTLDSAGDNELGSESELESEVELEVDDVNWCCGAWQKLHLREIIDKAVGYEQWL